MLNLVCVRGVVMGFFDFLKPKKQPEEAKVEPPVEVKFVEDQQKTKYVPELSMLELSEVDWAEFGARLKAQNLLPGSYNTTPINVKVSLTEQNIPCAIVTFASSTTDSTRRIEVYDRFVRRCGKSNDNPESVSMSQVWRDYQDFVHCVINLKHRREVVMHKQKAKFLKGIDGNNQELIEIFENFDKFFEKEDKFLGTHKNDTFDILSYHGENDLPCVAKCTSIGKISSDHIVPFSPKTLEFCVARLAEEEKHYIAHDIESFKEKCKRIENASPYQNKDWQKTVDLLCEVILERYKDKTTHHRQTTHQEEPENI